MSMKPPFHFSSLKPFSFTSENVERELQRCLANIQEVEDYVKIFKTNITSTEILPNLRTIHGKNLVYNKWVKTAVLEVVKHGAASSDVRYFSSVVC